MKIAIVYDRVNKFGGAERVLLALNEIFPQAPLYTSVYSPEKAKWAKVFPEIKTSFLNRFFFLRENHELLSIFMPLAFESFDFTGYDLVISVTSEAAKGIVTKPGTFHICYCLTPTRYLYSGYKDYEEDPPGKLKLIPFYGILSKPFIKYMKVWDGIASSRPDMMVAISSEVKKRIKKYYGRYSKVIFPPVETTKFNKTYKTNLKIKELEYFLIVSRLEPYKKVDLAIKAFIEMNKRLVVVGTGSKFLEYKNKYFENKNIIFKGFVSDRELISLYKGAKAFIFPQMEDFGITAVESQAAGCPVIAFGKGGALDTVIDGKTAVLFSSQTTKSIKKAVLKLDSKRFNRNQLLNNAKKFDTKIFKKEIMDLITKKV